MNASLSFFTLSRQVVFLSTVKRVFAPITVLICLSLIGIIFIQVSWIRNMVQLREEQIKHRLGEVTKVVTDELMEQSGAYLPQGYQRRKLLEGFGWDLFTTPTVASRHSAEDLRKRIAKAFKENDLNTIPFEFGLYTFDRFSGNTLQKSSSRFLQAQQDTAHNFYAGRAITAPNATGIGAIGVSEALFIVVPDVKTVVLRSLRWNIAVSILFTLLILSAFYLTIRTMLQQKKIGEMKNDFINNMTHEFKTPLATISLAVDAMRNDKVIQDREKLGYFSSIIKEENQRMNRQVETILKASQFERKDVDLNLKAVSLHETVQQVVDNFKLQLEHVGGHITLFLRASEHTVLADSVHLSNLLNNLVDNAVKYARENVPPQIQIETIGSDASIVLRVEDNGMGMSRDTLKRIFDKFYRAHTGNQHNVKGFGLGLSYVKNVTEALGGKIKADSTLGQGSVFTLELPLHRN
ncbi:MAG TPA: sensor histidine kinase [Chitinophagaceae bacterium]|nr:sensor histidine kinase [Chitinophagaceae bacterium]NCW87409.1 sensor histidine kinase [Chitinophagia bacterium]NDE77606.1 sensor histidine kinase [Chitinophagaceae bacterium]HAL95783.1 sensor histidine kinase [Chitinophagaceae bacterium]